ncbi:putative ribonuclease H-like domain-containing protein [Tanacetum coccineum]
MRSRDASQKQVLEFNTLLCARNESTASKSSKDSLEQPKDVRPSAPIIKEWEYDSNDDCVIRPLIEQNKPSYAKINFVKSDENTRKSAIEQNTYRQAENLRKSQSPRVDKRNWNGLMTQKLRDDFEFNKKAYFICGTLNHLIKDYNFYENKMVGKSVLNNMRNVLVKGSLTLVVSTAEGKRENVVKSLACWIWRPTGKGNPQYALQDQGIFDSGCSRHMTRNKSYLTDYQYIDEGFVAFAGSPKGGKITGRGKIRTEKLDVEDTECLILSPDFKLLDESQVLLKVPRQDNMYSFDLKNVVPSGDPLGKIDGKPDEGFLVGYSINSKAFKVFNTRTRNFTNVDDLPTDPRMPDLEDTADLLNTDIFSGAYDDEYGGVEADLNNLETTMNVSPIPTTRIHKDHPKDQIIRDINSTTQTRRMTKISEEHAMMDVKSTFLYGSIEEEVYVCQLPGFEDPQFLGKVYKVEKALYGLHQAPRAWYETLSTYLLENRFRRGIIDKTLFIKKDKGDIMLVQVYVDDIIFGSTKKSLCVEFEQMMHKKFQMSSMGELTFFLGLQVMQKDDGI